MTATDYNRVDPDTDKEPHEYHYTERRAEILSLIEQAGSPKRVDTKRLADRYDVTRGQIYQDLDRLGEFLEDTLGTRAKMRTQLLFERVLDNLLDEGKEREAWRTAMEWNEWLADRGAIEKAADKQEVDATVTNVDGDESESYEILDPSDDAITVEALPDVEVDASDQRGRNTSAEDDDD